jgi:hypothetical protein
MCDYSLHDVKSRPAKVGDKLTTRKFYSGTTGFSAPEDASMAVCVLPGTELSFTDEVRRVRLWPWSNDVIYHKTAIFRQVNQQVPMHHHDALEFPDGKVVLLTLLVEGQGATVLQLPAGQMPAAAVDATRLSEPGYV